MHSASDITSGTLPISRGGTNATSASSALSNLGGFSASGGTISGAVNITGKLDVQNNVMHIGSGSSGAKLNFGDGDYVYLYESTDDHLYIKADKGLHLQCGSSSSYDITVQHGSDAAISLLSGGGAKVVSGTFSASGSSKKNVDLGFKPMFVACATRATADWMSICVRTGTHTDNNSYSHYISGGEDWTGEIDICGTELQSFNGFAIHTNGRIGTGTYTFGYIAIG